MKIKSPSNLYFWILVVFYILVIFGIIVGLKIGSRMYIDSVGGSASAGPFEETTASFLEVKNPPRMIEAVVTAYSSDIWQTDDTPLLTAHQTPVAEGIAACPRNISFHTKIEILGVEYECLDRMALKNEGRFDIFFHETQMAKNFGIKNTWVTIWD